LKQNIENIENRKKSNVKRDLASFLQENEKSNSTQVPKNKQKITENKEETRVKSKREANNKKPLAINEHLEEEKGNEFIFLAPNNLPPSYLLDVKYDGKIEKAYVKLLNLEDGKIYRWYDNTGHLPYLITTTNKNDIEKLLKNEKDYVDAYARFYDEILSSDVIESV